MMSGTRRKLWIKSIGLIFGVFVSVPSAFATKTCPPHPCGIGDDFDRARCIEASDWVGVGTIKVLVRGKKKKPLNKSFSTFEFYPEAIEKGALSQASSSKAIRYRVGWCHNQREVPKSVEGKFRFYGLNTKTLDGENQYIHFEKIEGDSSEHG